MSHKVAYPISHWPGCGGAGLQAAATADRPLCAAMTAWAAHLAGHKLRGTLTGASDKDIGDWVYGFTSEAQVPWARARRWAAALGGDRLHIHEPDLRKPMDGLELDDYQVLVARSSTVAGYGVALDPGLGKTLTASAIARYVAESCQASHARCWIVSTLSAHGAWTRFLPELEAVFDEVKVLSIDSAHKYVAADRGLGGVLIIDECHEAGSGSSRRTKSMHEIRKAFDYCLALTGTLVEAGVEAVANVHDLIVPGGALFSSRWKIGEHFRCLVKTEHGTAIKKPPEALRESFQEWMSRLVIHLDHDAPEVQACLTIPPQHRYDIAVCEPWPDLDAECVRIIEEIIQETGEVPHMQEVIHKLCRLGIEAKVDWLLGMVEGDTETPVVAFCQYRDSLNYLQARLEEAGRTFVRVDGDTPKDQRPAIRECFQSGGAQFYIGQTKAGGISIDLDRATVSVCLDHSWKPVEYGQAIYRTKRRTQTAETHHFDLFANSLQRKIIERVRAAKDFSAECAEWQALKRVRDTHIHNRS